MDHFPELKIDSRDREFRDYSREEREAVVLAYLFEDCSFRTMDEQVLKKDSKVSRGWQSMGIIHHYGLTDEFKGLFSGMTVPEALKIVPDDRTYDFLFDILKESGKEEKEPHENPFAREVLGFNRETLQNVRVNQNVFRDRILHAYGSSCCLTGIRDLRLLRASHIKPWCESNATEKTDVRNGLCLNALHDCAFDCGLITVAAQTCTVRLSDNIEDMMDGPTYDRYFRKYDGQQVNAAEPEEGPGREYLEYHNRNIFEKKLDNAKIRYEAVIDQIY